MVASQAVHDVFNVVKLLGQKNPAVEVTAVSSLELAGED
jgi:hypothetical protein